MWLACSAVQNCPCKDIWATTQLFLGLKTGHQLLPQIYPVIPVIKGSEESLSCTLFLAGSSVLPDTRTPSVTRQTPVPESSQRAHTAHKDHENIFCMITWLWSRIQQFLLQPSVLRLTKWLLQGVPSASPDKVWYCCLKSAELQQDTTWPAQKLSDCQTTVSRSVLLPPETEIIEECRRSKHCAETPSHHPPSPAPTPSQCSKHHALGQKAGSSLSLALPKKKKQTGDLWAQE